MTVVSKVTTETLCFSIKVEMLSHISLHFLATFIFKHYFFIQKYHCCTYPSICPLSTNTIYDIYRMWKQLIYGRSLLNLVVTRAFVWHANQLTLLESPFCLQCCLTKPEVKLLHSGNLLHAWVAVKSKAIKKYEGLKSLNSVVTSYGKQVSKQWLQFWRLCQAE